MPANIMDTAGRFRGTLDEAMLLNNIQQTGVVLPGLPFMRRADGTNQEMGLDLPVIKKQGTGGVKVFSIGLIGDQGIGKTFLVNLICARLIMCEWGDKADYRVSFDSEKRNAGVKPETEELARFLNGESEDGRYVIPLADAQFNLFRMHYGMNVWYPDKHEVKDKHKFHITEEEVIGETFDLVIDVLEADDTELSDFEREILNIVMRPMMQDDSRSLTELCRRLLRFKTDQAKEAAAAELDIEANEATLIDEFATDYKRAALTLYLRVKRLLQGASSRLVNGTDDSLMQYMSSTMVSFDFKGLSDETRLLAHLILWQLRANAVLHNYWERFSRINVHDEAYGKWDIPSFARSQYQAKKTLRERGAVEIEIFHRLKDMESVGNAGSKEARAAENSVNEIAVWFIGRQPRSEFERLRERFNLPQNVLETLPTLRTGFFWLIVGTLAPMLVYIIPTHEELERFETDTASNDLLAQYMDPNDPELFLQYLEAISPEIVEETEEVAQQPERSTEADETVMV